MYQYVSMYQSINVPIYRYNNISIHYISYIAHTKIEKHVAPLVAEKLSTERRTEVKEGANDEAPHDWEAPEAADEVQKMTT